MEGGMLVAFNVRLPGPMAVETLREFLLRAPGVIEMTRITEPSIAGGVMGLTGAVILAESHIAVHEVRSHWLAIVHVFSCQRFDLAQALPVLAVLLRGLCILGEPEVIERELPGPVWPQ